MATTLVAETMAGAAELIRERGGDALAVRREVASPGGTTAWQRSSAAASDPRSPPRWTTWWEPEMDEAREQIAASSTR